MTSPGGGLENPPRWYDVGAPEIRLANRLRAVLVSYVLHLVPAELEEGRLVGEVEAVRTGERRAFHEVEDLKRFCQRSYISNETSRWRKETEGDVDRRHRQRVD